MADPKKVNSITGTALPSLIHYKELFVHLDQGLSTDENRHNEFPSTLLRTITVGTEACNTGKTAESLVKRQWKHLSAGALTGLSISVRDLDLKMMPSAYLSCVLEIKQKAITSR